MDDAARRLLSLLGRQAEALEAFAAVLDAERQALVARDGDALTAATERKSGCIAAVEALEQERRAIAPSLADMEAFTENPVIAERWERLLDLTRRCREQNDANGRMIRRQRTRVDSALGLLRGRPVTETPVYGPDGERRGPRQPRSPLASA